MFHSTVNVSGTNSNEDATSINMEEIPRYCEMDLPFQLKKTGISWGVTANQATYVCFEGA